MVGIINCTNHCNMACKYCFEENWKEKGINKSSINQKFKEAFDLFVDLNSIKKEKNLEKTIYKLKQDMGKNVILKGMNLQEKSTAKLRNTLVGGHNG